MTKTTLLIDGDVLAYKSAAACEVAFHDEDGYWTWFCNEREVQAAVNGEIATLLDELGADGYVLALTDSAENFRKSILPTYKSNRSGVKRPVALKGIRQWMLDEHETFLRPGLEGDDVLGILQREDDGLPEDIQKMVDDRALARKNKEWKKSDELRDAIKAAGYVLEDTPQGQKVRKSV